MTPEQEKWVFDTLHRIERKVNWLISHAQVTKPAIDPHGDPTQPEYWRQSSADTSQ